MVGKLVRTRLKDKIIEKNKDAKFIHLSEKELECELSRKLLEEVHEFINAPNSKNKSEEMADILEVIDTFYKLKILDPKIISKIKTEKLTERGGFVEGIYWKE